jgi:hypothetical protein
MVHALVGFDYRYRKMGEDEHEKNIFGQTNKKDTAGRSV